MKFFVPNFTHDGPGIKKDEPLKKGFPLFFELYFMRFWDLIKLNLIFILYSLPIITIAPAFSALTSITRSMVQRKHVYILSDFHDSFKQNWKQSLLTGFVSIVISALLCISILFYMKLIKTNPIAYLGFFLSIFLIVLLLLTNMYLFPLISTVSLSLKDIFKNSILLSIVCFGKTFFCLLICILLLGLNIILFPFTLPLFITLLFSTLSFIISFITYPIMQKFIIK